MVLRRTCLFLVGLEKDRVFCFFVFCFLFFFFLRGHFLSAFALSLRGSCRLFKVLAGIKTGLGYFGCFGW